MVTGRTNLTKRAFQFQFQNVHRTLHPRSTARPNTIHQGSTSQDESGTKSLGANNIAAAAHTAVENYLDPTVQCFGNTWQGLDC